MARSGIFVVVVLLLIGTVLALDGPSTYFSQSDVSSVKDFVVSSQKGDGSFGSLEDTYNAVSTLKRLGVEVPKAKEVIGFAKASLAGASLASTYHAVSILSQLGGDLPSEAFTAATSTLSKVDEATLEDASYSALILSHQKPVNKKIASLVERIAGLADTDGTYKNEEWDAGTVSHAALALKALAAVPTDILSSLESLTIEEAGLKVSDLISLGSEVEGAFSLSDSKVSAVKTTGGVIDGLNQLATKNAKVRSAITATQATQIAEFLVRNKVPHSLEDAHYLVAGLTSLTNGKLHNPVVLSVMDGALSSNSKTDFSFGVTDLFGKNVDSKVFLVKATSSQDPSKPLLRNQALSAESGLYKLNLLASKPEPGFYALELSAAPSDAKGNYAIIDSAKRTVKVLTTVDFSEGELALFDPSEELPLNKISVDGAGSKTMKLNPEQKIHFTFKLKNQQSGKLINRAQQVFAVLNNDKHEAVFIGKTTQKGYSIDISLTNSGLQSGEYELSLVVGDAFIQNPFQKSIAKITVHSRSSASTSEPTYSSALPEIHHVFRQPEKRPDISISWAFTGAVLFPVLVLLVGLGRVGANMSNFPTGFMFLPALAFHGFLLTLVGVLVCFWFSLPFLQTVKYLALFSIPTIFFGKKVLLHLATPKIKKE